MPLKLPDLDASKCLNLVVCGLLQTPDKPLLQWMKSKQKQRFQIAKTRSGGTTTYVRVGFGGFSPRHFHIELAPAHSFGGFPPEVDLKFGEFQKMAKKLEGEKVKIQMQSEYRISSAELPLIIRSATFESTVNDVSLKVTGGTIAVQGGPIQKIKWSLKDEAEAAVSIEGTALTTIDDEYLVDALAFLNAAFEGIVIGRKTNVRAHK